MSPSVEPDNDGQHREGRFLDADPMTAWPSNRNMPVTSNEGECHLMGEDRVNNCTYDHRWSVSATNQGPQNHVLQIPTMPIRSSQTISKHFLVYNLPSLECLWACNAQPIDITLSSSSLELMETPPSRNRTQEENEASRNTMVMGEAESDTINVPTKQRTLTMETSSSLGPNDSSANDKKGDAPNNDNVPAWSRRWTRTVLHTHGPILQTLQWLSGIAARYPRITIVLTTVVSLGLLLTGFYTNFSLDVGKQFAQKGSAPLEQGEFIRDHFVSKYRYLTVLMHGGFDEETNILGSELVERAFQIIDLVTSVPGYHQLCMSDDITYINPMTGEKDCEVYAVTRFWANNQTLFEQSTEEQVIQTLSGNLFSDGTPVSQDHLYGMRNQTSTGTLTSLRSSIVAFFLPSHPLSRPVEREALKTILRFRQQLRHQGDLIFLDVQSEVSLHDEFTRAISDDLPLVPIVFAIMSIFTAVTFTRWHKVHSRALLGFGAVATVLLSIAAGFGILFLCGTPFSNLTTILPFIIIGVGLDDAFILVGSYERTDSSKPAAERITEAIGDIGLSITLTTLTSAAAFGLGCLSSVYAVVWLCSYAVPMVLLVFLYTITFFVALIVLDEQRIKEGRFDCCVCIRTKRAAEQTFVESYSRDDTIDRIMVWYSKIILQPMTQAIVVIVFVVLFVNCAISASKFTEEFNFKDALPRDSYLADFTEAYSKTVKTGFIEPNVYFRYVDFESTDTRAQMREYLSDLAESKIFDGPRLFWLDFFEMNAASLPHLNFTAQMDHFLSNELYAYLFERDISRDEHGNVVASRVRMRIRVDTESASDQIAAMETQEAISKAQPVNTERQNDLAFFCYDGVFKLWEFLRIAKRQLVITTIVSVLAVTVVALIFIPHWSAVLFVFPLVCILFVDLLGVLQWAGLHINPVSYVSLAMSIGLIVDYLMHILFRFYEVPGNRREKTVTMLRQMGGSILLGGITTWLGTIPLMFSSSDVFKTVYVTFLGIVLLGVGHGLVLLPVLLSLVGPETHVPTYFNLPVLLTANKK